MPSSQSEWEGKHRLAREVPPSEPASIVCELLPLLPRGPALDIACGTGRHALVLAARGQQVTAIDWSASGLGILEEHARAMEISVRRIRDFEKASGSHHGGIDILEADLERRDLPEHFFDLILCIQYLQRSLFPQMCRALRPDGMLLFETYTRTQLEFRRGPRNPAFLLEAGELRNAFPELRMLFYRELCAGQGIASLLAEKPGPKR
jgi:SAM-dependent methyltransferase